MSRYDVPLPTHLAGDEVHGFRIDAVTELRDIRVLCYECTHLKTGAKLLHLHCNDQENLYAIAFRTPPRDSTGVAHILEHCVLAGSRKYPVKDAFNELRKASLHTFLNAMTWPDRTVYPVCSAVHADYFNLAEVYTDLVLHPLITEGTFRQEGHHLTLTNLDDLDSDLAISGVVYNEMKGVYSSPESLVFKLVQEGIFPDSTYGVDSGGDPEVIPSLTYQHFREFHRKLYSPSNAKWYLYGDIPLERHLAFLSHQLKDSERLDLDSRIKDQPRWALPRRRGGTYPIGEQDDPANRTFINIAWMLDSAAEPEQVILFDVLEEALVGNAAGPLRKALIDSGLGQDLSPVTGHDKDFIKTLFVAGLRGGEPERASQVEKLVLETLAAIADRGLDPDLVEAAFHQIEFRGKEIIPPFPVMLLFRAAGSANYGGDPKASLEFGDLIRKVRRRYASEPDLLSNLIREWLIDNPHRLLSVVSPSRTLSAEREAASRARMAEQKAAMTRETLERIRDDARGLREAQETPDSPDALATIPKLNLADIPRRLLTVPTLVREANDVRVLEHEVFSNGVAYLDLAFDVSDLREDETPLVPLLGCQTAGLGAAGLDYARMATRIASTTGGITTEPTSGSHVRTGHTFQRLTFKGKALERNLPELTAVLRDLLIASDTADLKRIRDILLEERNSLFSQIVPSGHLFAYYRAGASLSLARYRMEQWLGATQVSFLTDLVGRAQTDLSRLAERLAGLQRRLFTRNRLLVNVTGDPDLIASLRPLVDDLIASLPEAEPGPPIDDLPEVPRSVGVTVPTEVNHVGLALPVRNLLEPGAPEMEMLASVIDSEFLYQKLRVQGGAYGAYCLFSLYDGLLFMLSYRDPQILETLRVFSCVPDFVRSENLTHAILERSKVGAIGNFDRILSPEQQADFGLRQHLLGLTDEDRRAFRDGLFDVSLESLRKRALPILEEGIGQARKAVVASREAVDSANQKLDPPFLITALEQAAGR